MFLLPFSFFIGFRVPLFVPILFHLSSLTNYSAFPSLFCISHVSFMAFFLLLLVLFFLFFLFFLNILSWHTIQVLSNRSYPLHRPLFPSPLFHSIFTSPVKLISLPFCLPLDLLLQDVTYLSTVLHLLFTPDNKTISAFICPSCTGTFSTFQFPSLFPLVFRLSFSALLFLILFSFCSSLPFSSSRSSLFFNINCFFIPELKSESKWKYDMGEQEGVYTP